jgi:LemA protein
MKRGGLLAIALIALLLIMVGGCLVGNYNRLVTTKEAVSQRWAQVDNQLQRRNDLIGGLVESVRGTALQEQQVFGDIARARAAMAGARSGGQDDEASRARSIEAGRAMDSALSRLLVVIENYPQLRSNEAFLQLMDELSGTENRLATERMRYNEEVQRFNVLIKRFPTNVYAGMFNFAPATYYEIPDTAREAPRIDFGGLRNPAGATDTAGAGR